MISLAAGAHHAAQPRELLVHHGAQEFLLGAERPALLLGRDAACDVVLTDPKASRQHARIEKRRDKFFLVDQSSNGTYLTFEGDPEIGLRREEAMLRRSGRIVFGHSAAEPTTDVVTFAEAAARRPAELLAARRRCRQQPGRQCRLELAIPPAVQAAL
jgi:hypothetical protein